MIFFGSLSCILGFVRFNVPGIQGATSDLREIPLLISLFYISNPWTTIIACLLTTISTLPGGSHLTTFLMHVIPLYISWYVYDYLKSLNKEFIRMGIIWFIYVFIYYLVLVQPICVLTNFLVGLNTEKSFFQFYYGLTLSNLFEIITSSIITSLFLIQHKMSQTLHKHKAELEVTVKERTEELVSTIEELKTTQQHLIQSERMASIGTLTAGVAHEINNPLNFIAGGILLLEEIQKEENNISIEKAEKYNSGLGLVKEGFERSSGIVKALMNFSRSGDSVLTDGNIHQIIDNTLLFLDFMLTDIKIVKDYKLQVKIPLYSEKMHQVFLHLIDNAIYAINLNTTNTRTISISTYKTEKNAVLRLSNTGPKIPEKYVNQIFDPFFTTKDPDKGKGIGLSICYSIISEHKGEIYVENNSDFVSFVIELPLERRSPEE